jgi:hypothetical protein
MGASKPLQVMRFDKTKLDEDILDDLLKLKNGTEKEYKYCMQKYLPDALSFRKQQKEELSIEKQARLPMQIVGNCSWAATEGIVKTLILLHTKDAKTLDKTFTSWQVQTQAKLLEKYLKNPLDPDLVYHSFNALWIAKKRFPSSINSERLKALEDMFMKDKSKAEQKRFKTHKVLSQVIQSRKPLRILQAILGTLSFIFSRR